MFSAPQNFLILTVKTPLSENNATFLKPIFFGTPWYWPMIRTDWLIHNILGMLSHLIIYYSLCNLWSDSSALMFPTIDDHQVYDVKLARADIKAIQRLYGPRTKKSTLTTSSSASKPGKLLRKYTNYSKLVSKLLLFIERLNYWVSMIF